MKSSDRILVLNVDRDNDIGQKTGIKGPIIGRENVLKAGNEMGLADPECSDFNAIFQAAKTYDEMKKQYATEIAVLTGDKNVGVKSDRIIGEQLRNVLEKFHANYAVLVTDGSEDERIMPVIQSKVPILSVKRVVVKQADQIQSIYFKAKDFLKETLDDPKVSRLVFGIPAIMLIIYAIWGLEGWRLMLGIIGAFLFIKGFKLDDYVLGAGRELESSFRQRKFAFFGYVVGMTLFVLATWRGYFGILEHSGSGMLEMAAGFVTHSVYLYFLGGTIAWTGKSATLKKRRPGRIAAIPLFGLAITLVAYTASEVIINPASTGLYFILSIVGGFILMLAAVILEWKG